MGIIRSAVLAIVAVLALLGSVPSIATAHDSAPGAIQRTLPPETHAEASQDPGDPWVPPQ
jgi:hypothetical protein